MSRPKPRRRERNAGAFLGPDVMIPVPMRTLSDDIRDEPTEPEDSDREPEPEPPGLIRRVVERLARRADPVTSRLERPTDPPRHSTGRMSRRRLGGVALLGFTLATLATGLAACDAAVVSTGSPSGATPSSSPPGSALDTSPPSARESVPPSLSTSEPTIDPDWVTRLREFSDQLLRLPLKSRRFPSTAGIASSKTPPVSRSSLHQSI